MWLTPCPCWLALAISSSSTSSRFPDLLQPIDFCIHQDFWLHTFKVHASVVVTGPRVHGVFVPISRVLFPWGSRGPGGLGQDRINFSIDERKTRPGQTGFAGTVVHMGDKNKSYVNKVPSRRATCMR